MGKYEPLTRYLENLDKESWEARFADVERILGFDLPRSAYDYPAWWANQDPGHSQTRGWRDAGWETGSVNLAARQLRFARSTKRLAREATARSTRNALLQKARIISGICDHEELIDAGLKALIQREAARNLIALGGAMPDFTPAPRERPFS